MPRENLLVTGSKHDRHEIIKETFKKTTTELQNRSFDVDFSGTTCVSVILCGQSLLCANVGDSRAILATLKTTEPSDYLNRWLVTPLSIDHKPDIGFENERIISHGGRVESYRDLDGNPIGPSRVWLKTQNIPGLAMSRSLGDWVAREVGVISEPGIYIYIYIYRNIRSDTGTK